MLPDAVPATGSTDDPTTIPMSAPVVASTTSTVGRVANDTLLLKAVTDPSMSARTAATAAVASAVVNVPGAAPFQYS
jgi:hypothetical protein